MTEKDKEISIGDYDAIMTDRNIFNQIVYTPLSDALRLLDERRKDTVLMAKIEKLIGEDVPALFKNKKCAILCRQLATPNYDARSFISTAIDNDLEPVFFEFLDDKFTPENEFKHSLAQLIIHKDKNNKKGENIEEKITIIDFNRFNGKKIKDINTLKGESLINFHRKLFDIYKFDLNKLHFIDGSNWVKNNGQKANKYYLNLFIIFTCYGILFENFFTSKNSEGDFTKNILLPTIEKVLNITGLKPLIVPISPIETEDSKHCLSYSPIIKKII